jgi:glucose/arabinose dehydrogenase
MRRRVALLGLLALGPLVFLAATGGGSASAGGGGFALQRVGNFDPPVYVTAAPGFPRLLFVVEKAGRIKVVRRGRKLERSFLNITGLVNSAADERGLLSVAFPPDYKRTKRFYVYYTDSEGDIRIDEFHRRTAVVAARGSRRAVLQIPHQSNSNHNGGQLQFLGRLLFVGTGDGGSGDDPPDNAKNKRRLLGKLLRIDPRNPRGRRDYRIPRSNPFVGRRGRDEIFSIGLRNPWRFSFDTVSTRRPRIVIADVGQNRFEEIDYEKLGGARGAHFGWDEWEGFVPHECDGRCARGTRKPIFAYGRGSGCTVIGGYVVRDRQLGSLYGRYLFTDLCEGSLRSLAPRLRRVDGAPPVGVGVRNPTSFGEDRAGRVYVASLDGPVFRLVAR